MRKKAFILMTPLILFSCASVEEYKSVKTISSVPVKKKDYFAVGKVNPFTEPMLKLKEKQVEVEVVETPLPVVMEGVCRQAGINCDSKSWEKIPLPLTLKYKGNLYDFLKEIEKKYSLKFSYDGKVLKLYDYDQFEVEEAVKDFYSEIYKQELPKVTATFVESNLGDVFKILSLSSGWSILADSSFNPSREEKLFTYSAKEKSLKEVLDAVADAYGLSYKVFPSEKKVVFSRFITKVYRIPILPKNTKYSYTVSVKSADGKSNVKKKVKVEEEFWKTVESQIKNLISKDGKFFISPESGVVSITDRPQVVKRIDRVMRNTIKEALSEVSFRVAVYEVVLNRNISTGINWGTILHGAKVRVNASGGTSYVLNWVGNGSLFGNPFEYLVKALENYGKVRVLYDNYVKTKSGEQVSIYPTYDYRYISKLTVNYLDNGQISVEPEFDSMTLGMQISLVPKRINEEETAFDVVVTNASLVSEEQYTFGDSSFTNPKLVSNNKVSFSSILKRGQLEVLTGWKGYRIEDNNTGVPLISEIPGVGLAFKGKNRKASISEFVVAIYVY